MDEDSEIRTGSGGVSKIFTKRNFIIAGVVIVAALVAFVIISFVNRPKNNTTVQSALNSSSDAFAKGDYTGALAALQGVSSQAMTKQQKVELYGSMASAAISGGKLKDALHYYDLKHQADPNTAKQDAYSMAVIYERLNDKQKAIDQYKVAIDFYKSQNNTLNNSNNDLPVMEARLKALEAQ